MNASIMQNPEFVERVREEIKFLESRTIGSSEWESSKTKIKEVVTTVGRREAARGRATQNRLMSTLRDVIEAVKERHGEFREDIRVTKKELFNELEHRYWGTLVRSREQRVEQEAQPSKIFRTLERENATRKNTEVEHHGQIARGAREVASAFDDFYSSLFNLQIGLDPVPENDLGELPKVSEDLRELINSAITAAEVETVIKQLPGNKSPVPDGIF